MLTLVYDDVPSYVLSLGFTSILAFVRLFVRCRYCVFTHDSIVFALRCPTTGNILCRSWCLTALLSLLISYRFCPARQTASCAVSDRKLLAKESQPASFSMPAGVPQPTNNDTTKVDFGSLLSVSATTGRHAPSFRTTEQERKPRFACLPVQYVTY